MSAVLLRVAPYHCSSRITRHVPPTQPPLIVDGSGEHITHASDRITKFYSRPELVAAVIRYYAIDYRLLPLPIPQWAVDMVGVGFIQSLGLPIPATAS
jgi:hypothetical protein